MPKNLTSNLNKNGHRFNPKLRPLSVKIKVKNCITGKEKMQVSKLRHAEVPRVLLIPLIHNDE